MFLDDLEKVNDLLSISKDEFLKSYSYITENEYNETLKEVNKTESLCNICNKAKEVHYKDLDGFSTGLEVTGMTIMCNVLQYAIEHRDKIDIDKVQQVFNAGC